jgi:hypothetical protein
LTVEELGALAEAIAERFDDDDLQGEIGSGLAPIEGAEALNGHFALLTGGEAADPDPGD